MTDTVIAGANRFFPDSNWTSHMFVDDEVMDDQLKHHLAMMFYGMSDLGECLEVARDLRPADECRRKAGQGMGSFGRPRGRCGTPAPGGDPSRGRLGYLQGILDGLLLFRADIEDHRNRKHIGAGLPAG